MSIQAAIKKANVEVEYTPEQVMEMRKCILDPIYFIEQYCVIQHPVKGDLPFKMYPYQIRMVKGYHENKLVINLSPRQSGKSWTCGAYFLWYACFNPGKILMIASNKNANAKEMIKRVQYMYERLPDWIKPGIVEYNKHDIKFDNEARIISQATTEDTGRGFSISKLFLDEFAFVPANIQAELWASLSPTLSTGGSLIICSTPNGDVDIFSQLWRGANTKMTGNSKVGVNGFYPIAVKWDEVPGRDESFKMAEIAKIGETKWKQEYECQFISSDPLLIDTLTLANLTPIVDAITPLAVVEDTTIFEDPVPGATYLIGMDPSTGSGEDYTTIEVVKFPEMEQVMEYRSNTASPAIGYYNLKKIIRLYERAGCSIFFSVERNGVGEAIITLMEVDEDPFTDAQFVSDDIGNRSGMTTTAPAKMRACLALKDMLEKNELHIKSNALLTELKHFVRSKGAYNAQRGATDDLISALLIVIRLLSELASFDQSAYDKIYKSDYTDEDFNEWDEYDTSSFIVI